ncbi:hypothetical protein JL720_7177 [Aureococcus anophagefferens]|nr:hypothetical protein JL720_7177 [Aureococcus anophagefferens]
MVTASGERIVGKAISADSPAFFHVAHAEVNPELGRRLKRSKGPPFVPGKDRIEAARRAAARPRASPSSASAAGSARRPAAASRCSARPLSSRRGGDDGALYRVVSVYRADNGGARVVCYDPRTCAYGRLLLLEERLEELHVGPAPATPTTPPGAAASSSGSSSAPRATSASAASPSSPTASRSTSPQRPPRAAARASDAPAAAPPGDRAPPRPDAAAAASPVVLRHPPSRHMVTQWFDFM